MNEIFNVDEFISGLKHDKSKERSSGNSLVKVIMNQKDHQGTITFIPFISKNVGNIYSKYESVKEWWGSTSLLDKGGGWYKILPLKAYDGITPEQIELYNEVVGLFDAANSSGKFGWGKKEILRVRNYSLFTGICLKHTNTDGKTLDDNKDKPCLFIFPSNSPIDALDTCISSKAELLGPKINDFIRKIITPSLTNRSGIIQITFKKATIGYDASVNFETNTEFNEVVDPKREFSPEVASLFDDPKKAFLGWMYDHENKTYFNETAFIELRKSLKAELMPDQSKQPEASYENKNGSSDPMVNEKPPIPSVDSEPKTQSAESGGFKPPF